jgi:Fe-S cluster assembly iron-binding protein IscA
MLALTGRAAASLAEVRSQKGLPDHFGVRIFTSPRRGERATFQVGFVEGPEEGDEVGEKDGTRFFVAPEIAGSLAGHVLDAQEPGERRLVLRRRR